MISSEFFNPLIQKLEKRFIIFLVLDPWIFVMFQGWVLFILNFKNYVNINQDISFLGKTKMHPVHKISKLLLRKQLSLFQSSKVDHLTYSKFEFFKFLSIMTTRTSSILQKNYLLHQVDFVFNPQNESSQGIL